MVFKASPGSSQGVPMSEAGRHIALKTH
uniref:Uncharacterized protein n=1 Tax=Arundo donax TaxID=35708 RepID=A0A0A8YHT4_ARUDO